MSGTTRLQEQLDEMGLATILAILEVTPPCEQAAVASAWQGLGRKRRNMLASWSPSFVAGWLRGLVHDWDDAAPVNGLPTGRFARRLITRLADGTLERSWCIVQTLDDRQGELVPVAGHVPVRAGTVAFTLLPDDTAQGD